MELGIWDFRREKRRLARPLLKGFSMLTPALLRSAKVNEVNADFWLRLFNDEALKNSDDLEKIVIGCEIIAALDGVDLLAA